MSSSPPVWVALTVIGQVASRRPVAVIEVIGEGLLLKAYCLGWTVEEIQSVTEPKLIKRGAEGNSTVNQLGASAFVSQGWDTKTKTAIRGGKRNVI